MIFSSGEIIIILLLIVLIIVIIRTPNNQFYWYEQQMSRIRKLEKKLRKRYKNGKSKRRSGS